MEFHMLDKKEWLEVRQKTGTEKGQQPIVQKSGYVYVGKEYADMEARVFVPSSKETQEEDFSVHMMSIGFWDDRSDSIDDLKEIIERATEQATSKERKSLLDKALSKLISKSKYNPLLQDPDLVRWDEWAAIKSLIIACAANGNCLLKHDPFSDQEFVDPNKMISTSLDIIKDSLFDEYFNNPARQL